MQLSDSLGHAGSQEMAHEGMMQCMWRLARVGVKLIAEIINGF